MIAPFEEGHQDRITILEEKITKSGRNIISLISKEIDMKHLDHVELARKGKGALSGIECVPGSELRTKGTVSI